MAKPASRSQFINYCKRQLGAPVLEINVAEEQVEDIVDDAINNESTFKNFKRNSKYNSIVGMCNELQAKKWLERAEKESTTHIVCGCV